MQDQEDAKCTCGHTLRSHRDYGAPAGCHCGCVGFIALGFHNLPTAQFTPELCEAALQREKRRKAWPALEGRVRSAEDELADPTIIKPTEGD